MPPPRLLFIIAVFISVASPQTLTSQAISRNDQWITLRVLPSVQPNTLAYLARVAEPVRKTLPKPAAVRDIIVDGYGYYSDQLFSLLQSENASIARPTDILAGDVVLPVSPKFEYNKRFIINQPDYYVSNLAATKMGAFGTEARRQIKKLNPTLDFKKMLINTEVILPYVAEPITFRLRPDFAVNAKEVIARLDRSRGVFHSEQISGFKTISYWPSQLDSADSKCDQPMVENWWVDRLFGHLTPGNEIAGTSVIAVADSGIAVDDERFRPVYWINNKEVRGEEDEDNDHNGCYHDVIGCNFITFGFPEDDLDLDDTFHHGTHVAGLASGRSLPDALKTRVTHSIRLMILKIANSEGLIEPGRIHAAITYAQEKQSKIVNMSLEGDSAGTVTRNLMKSNPQILFVVAAGNDGHNLDDPRNEVYPAVLGRELPNVITVAASDEKQGLACFSNYGEQTVMIAAPGLNMYSTIDVGEQFHSGTSQATPLVSLAAALLDAQGMHETTDIKLRLFNTVSFVRGLKVQSEGILNIDKALATDVDVLETTGGEVLKGTIESPRTLRIAGTAVRLSGVESVIINHALTGKGRDRVWMLKRGSLEHADTDLGSLVISIRLQNGQMRSIDRNDLSSITPAWNRN